MVEKSRRRYQVLVFVLTFAAYIPFHAARKAFSNAKSNLNAEWDFSTKFLGLLDTVFMFSYAFGLYMSGLLGDRFNLRKFLLIGMLGTSGTLVLFGLAKTMNTMVPAFFVIAWIANGLFQSTGWPSCVSTMGNWFGEKSRGRIFGFWSSNMPLGNIVGSLLVSVCVHYQLAISWMFALPALLMLSMAVFVYFLFIPKPSDVGLGEPASLQVVSVSGNQAPDGIEMTHSSHNGQLQNGDSSSTPEENHSRPLGLLAALALPGVSMYALSFACLKMVNYSLFFWLPYYLDKGLHFSSENSDLLSNLFDVGQVFGGVIAGYISDRLGKRSPVMILFLIFSVASLAVYQLVSTSTQVSWLLVVSGFFIGGPTNIIVSAISVDLGANTSLRGNTKALATVTGIIDGTGSFGAALGQYIIALISEYYGWDSVFIVLMLATAASGLMISPLFFHDMNVLCCAAVQYEQIMPEDYLPSIDDLSSQEVSPTQAEISESPSNSDKMTSGEPSPA